MKIVIPGGSGQVGTVLARAFHGDGHDVVVLSRDAAPRPWRVAAWDGATLGRLGSARSTAATSSSTSPAAASTAATRRPTGARSWTRACSRRAPSARRSRRRATPAARLAAGEHRDDLRAPLRRANDEQTGSSAATSRTRPTTWRFSIDVARAWERAFDEAPRRDTRKVALRSAMTMSPDRGGIFDTLLGLVRRGLGGRAGDGRQFMSWIHDDGLRRRRPLADRARRHRRASSTSPSPNPLPNAEFMRAAARGVRRAVRSAGERWMLEIGALFMRTETELDPEEPARRAGPVARARIRVSGFRLGDAARDLCDQWKTKSAATQAA